jgi:monofunctional biosynthetic peptidoglycan transglycosylase
MGNFRTRLLTIGRSRKRLAAWIFAAAIWLPASQCAWLNVIDPWMTSTMVEVAWKHWRKTGELDWPEYRPVSLSRVPRHVVAAVLTSEDQAFFQHSGFDLDAIRRAWKLNQRGKGNKVRGASTVSQQVAKNVFLWQGRNWARKALETWYTIWLELLVPKARIMEVYLNVAETGPMTFGIDAAAQRWYRKEPEALTAEESATIVSMLPAPRSWSPKSDVVQEHAAAILQKPIRPPKGVGR